MQRYYWYAVIPASRPLPPTLRGWQDMPLSGVREGDLVAVLCSVTSLDAQSATPATRLHASLLEGMMAATSFAILPMRFGTLIADPEDARTELRRHQSEWLDALQRVEGAAEFTVEVLWDPPAATPAPPPSKAGYLTRLAADQARLRTLRGRARERSEPILERLAGLDRERRSTLLPRPNTLLEASYLVPEGAVQPFRARVEVAESLFPSYRWLLGGPWPPYHFAPGGSWDDG